MNRNYKNCGTPLADKGITNKDKVIDVYLAFRSDSNNKSKNLNGKEFRKILKANGIKDKDKVANVLLYHEDSKRLSNHERTMPGLGEK